jgi:hypothetical protein
MDQRPAPPFFTGKVIQIIDRKNSDGRVIGHFVTLRFIKRWGMTVERLTISTSDINFCGFPFVEGLEYFVDARKIPDGYETSTGSTTVKLTEATELIRVVDKIFKEKISRYK